jgi:hypothetical protein
MAVALSALVGAANVQTVPDPDKVSPGFAGFLAIFVLAVATVFLLRSMVKHLRKVRYSPDPNDPDYRADQDWPRIGLPPTAPMAERSGDAPSAGPTGAEPGQRAGHVVHDQRIDTRGN